MKKLPIDVSTFETLRTHNYIYVDKTEILYNLLQEGRYYFLSRPRRFGKSLLVSTFKELFFARKHLFKDLWIEASDYDWQQYPVIHLDMATIPHLTSQELRDNINTRLYDYARLYNCAITAQDTPERTLYILVQQLAAQNNKVVILVDEYDKPILDHLHNLDEAKKQRDILKSFYGIIKGLDEHLHFVLLTGVSKFSKTSIFSGLNNLNDISLKPEAAALLGYTEEELKKYFSEYIENVAGEHETSKQAIMQEMKQWYNGYRFSRQKTLLYNPFSVMYYLKDREISNYWFESGTPSFLIELLKKEYEDLEGLEHIEWSSEVLGTFDIDYIHLIVVLFQAGYLTIADYDRHTRRYMLDYPNRETKESFQKYVLAALVGSTFPSVERITSQLRNALASNDVNSFCAILKSLFAHIPYHLHIAQERYYHSLFQLLGSLIGMDLQSEVATDKGRIDLVVSTPTHIYIFELKFKHTAQQALQQIIDRKYYERYLLQKKKEIVLVGISFAHEKNLLTLECAVQSYEG